ncbi:MAG: amidohydrolase [Thermodesulfovibrionales bacterium]|nr:amidohydrolase [Thermodesulfovibrionales bacterium]
MPQRVDLIVCGDYVVTMNQDLDLIKNGALAVKDKRIVAIGTQNDISKRFISNTVIGGNNFVVLPGFINTHTHAAMVFFRGLADDLPLKQWLEDYMWPAENALLSEDFVYDAVQLACLEMIKGGTTTFCDMYFFGKSASKATINAGMRAVMGVGILDFPTVSAKTQEEYILNVKSMIDTYKGHELITPCVAPHALYTCSENTLKIAKSIADNHNIPIHIHLSETEWEVNEVLSKHGKRPVKYLEDIGFLDSNVIAAHCVWLNSDEIQSMAKHKASVSHCIESNLKLSSGIAPIPEMINAGVKVSLGTDGAASNNDLSMIGEMSTTAKVHKAISKDPTILDSKTVLLMATRWGAEALGMGDRLGSLQEGKFADIILIDIRKPHLSPIYNIYSHIVYSLNSADVDTVIINGKIIMENRSVITIDEDETLNNAAMWSDKIKQKVKID